MGSWATSPAATGDWPSLYTVLTDSAGSAILTTSGQLIATAAEYHDTTTWAAGHTPSATWTPEASPVTPWT